MDGSGVLEGLNPAQREAVSAPMGPLRVLAGAGSGKTRVLVHRIAWLVGTGAALPWTVLAVTFTNKAATEMRSRIDAMLGYSTRAMWIGTFHGIAHRLLRTHWEEAGLPQGFQVIDADDQLRLLRRTMRALQMDEKAWPPRQAQWFINAQKDAGLAPEHVDPGAGRARPRLIEVYRAYQEACARSGLVDFGELLMRSHALWRDRPAVLAQYRERFAHVLVDEFQDTNTIQYAWLRLLTGDAGDVFVVGDDDQSIYGWRGARIENIQRFSTDFQGTRTIRLEQNYRSTGTILAAANALIAHNAGRLGKRLWTEGEEGEPIEVYAAYNEYDEARFAGERIQQWVAGGGSRGDTAVLYRSNAQSRVLEETLIGMGMPYRVYGGLRFFERAEIKDALAYLRLLANRDDDASFERVVNLPPRGIGERTVEALRASARREGISMWAAARGSAAALSGRAAKAVAGFLDLLDRLDREGTLGQRVKRVIDGSGLAEMYRKEQGEKGEMRLENLDELVNAAAAFESVPEDVAPGDAAALDPLAAFLTHAALEAGERQGGDRRDSVQLMTMHSAKGLEFPLVFLVGMEDGLFPHARSIEDPARLEEERRLAYVGLTRAKVRVHLSYAQRRSTYGRDSFPQPSRFVSEIPPALVMDLRQRARVSQPVYRPAAGEEPDRPFRSGDRVRHPRFGEGVVVALEGAGEHGRVQVSFAEAGAKWLVTAYAKLQRL